MNVVKRNGESEILDPAKYSRQIEWACQNIEGVSAQVLKRHVAQTFFDGITTTELNKNLERGAQELSTPTNPHWTFVAAKFVLQDLYKTISGTFTYPHLSTYLDLAIAEGKLNPILKTSFDIQKLNAVIRPECDFQFDYLGLSTVRDRYLLRGTKRQLIEMPQHWLMRVCMGVAIDELSNDKRDPTAVAIGYYQNLLSEFDFMSSTPTLFNSGLMRAQLSSCFGVKMGDDFDLIWDSLKEAGAYSKYGGGIGMDFTDLRGQGSPIKSMGGEAGGPIPYIKLLNDTLIGFDQLGKRRGSGSPSMELWHQNIEDFLSLHEPGDERQRAHDTFPALWIPDLFMERMLAGDFWSLFDPVDVPGLHTCYGEEFVARYTQYEQQGLAKSIVSAEDLWDTMLTRLCAHGVFWHCYKDRINERYPLREIAAVLHVNLCTEICLRSSDDVSYVCNLGSINVSKDVFLLKKDPATGKFLWNEALSRSVMHAIRFLDSVISVGLVPSERGRRMQEQDRPIGLGVMGWTVALYKLGIDYESREHVEYANEVMKQIAVAAMFQSAKLGKEKGSFPTFKHSTWAQGILTHETLVNRSIVEAYNLDLSFEHCPFVSEERLRQMVMEAFRNSTLLAIAPTATISNIVGTEQCTELPFKEVFGKKNLSGEFKTIAKLFEHNRFGLPIKTAYRVDHKWTIDAAAARQVWICQAQSTNFYVDSKRHDFGDTVQGLYLHAWRRGLKTTYYLYGQGEEAGDVQANPIDVGADNMPDAEAPACFLRPGDPGWSECESCQ